MEECVCAITIETLLKNNLHHKTHPHRLLHSSFKLIAMPRIYKSRRTCHRRNCSRSIWTKRSPSKMSVGLSKPLNVDIRHDIRKTSCVLRLRKTMWLLGSVINPHRRREKNHFLAKTTCEKTDVASLPETRDTYEYVQNPSCDAAWLELGRCFACRQRSYRTFCPWLRRVFVSEQVVLCDSNHHMTSDSHWLFRTPFSTCTTVQAWPSVSVFYRSMTYDPHIQTVWARASTTSTYERKKMKWIKFKIETMDK